MAIVGFGVKVLHIDVFNGWCKACQQCEQAGKDFPPDLNVADLSVKVSEADQESSRTVDLQAVAAVHRCPSGVPGRHRLLG